MILECRTWDQTCKGSRGVISVRDEDHVYEWLDRVLINEEWGSKYQNGHCINEVAIGSDHSPIILSTNPEIIKNKIGFWFEEMWLENPECKEVIKAAWGGENHHSMSRCLWPKLSDCRRGLIRWSKTKFGNNMTELRKAKDLLREVGESQLNSSNQEE